MTADDSLQFKANLAKAFIDTQSFQYDETTGFQLASGVMSPYYVDCRRLMAHPGPRHLVAQLAVAHLYHLEFECLGGLELGAISLATAISAEAFASSLKKEWRTFVVRKQPKGHGLGKLIEGAVETGDRAVIVDDVLTSGHSIIRAAQAARESGLEARHVLVLVDRQEQEGRARVEALGLSLISVVTIRDLTSSS